MKFPVDVLAGVSQAELERSAQSYMTKLLYSNPDSPEHLTLPDSTKVEINVSTVGLVPFYGSSDTQKVLALFAPADLFTPVALYLLDQWWTISDLLQTGDSKRDGAVQVEQVAERIVLYVLNRVVYRTKEMCADELPFLCHGEMDYAKILWSGGEAAGFYSVKPAGSMCSPFSSRSFPLPVMDSMFVRKCFRGKGLGLRMLEDYVDSFREDSLGLRYPLTTAMYKVCACYLRAFPRDSDLLWEVDSSRLSQRTTVASKIQTINLRSVSKTLTYLDQSIRIHDGTTVDTVTEEINTTLEETQMIHQTVETVEEVTIMRASKGCEEVPVSTRGRGSGSKHRTTGEKHTEEQSHSVIRISEEVILPRFEHNSEEVRTEDMLNVATENAFGFTFTERKEEVLFQKVMSLQKSEKESVRLGPVTSWPHNTPHSPNTLCSTVITVENVASEMEGSLHTPDYNKEDELNHQMPEDTAPTQGLGKMERVLKTTIVDNIPVPPAVNEDEADMDKTVDKTEIPEETKHKTRTTTGGHVEEADETLTVHRRTLRGKQGAPTSTQPTRFLTRHKTADLELTEGTGEQEPALVQEQGTLDRAEGDVAAETEDTVEETQPEESTCAEAEDTQHPKSSQGMKKESPPDMIMEEKEAEPSTEKEQEPDALPKEPEEPAPPVETRGLPSGPKIITATPRRQSTTVRQDPQQETQDEQSEVAVEVDLSIDLSVAGKETSSEVLANEAAPAEAIVNENNISEAVNDDQPQSETKAPEEAPSEAIIIEEEPSKAIAIENVELSSEGVVETRVLRSGAKRDEGASTQRTTRSRKKKAEEEIVETTAVKRGRKSTGRKQVSRTVKTTQEEGTYSAEDTKDWPQLQSATVDQAPIEGVEVPDVGLVPLNMSQSEDTKHHKISVDSNFHTQHQRTTDRLDPQQETQNEPQDKPREEPQDAVEAQSEAAVEVGPSKAVVGKETSSQVLANEAIQAETIANKKNMSEAVDNDQHPSETMGPEESPSEAIASDDEEPSEAMALEDVELSAEELVKTSVLRSGSKQVEGTSTSRATRSRKKKAEEETVETTVVKRGRNSTRRKQVSRTVKTTQQERTFSAEEDTTDVAQATVDQATIAEAEAQLQAALEKDKACINEPVTDSETIVLTKTEAKEVEIAEDTAAKGTREEEPAQVREEDNVDRAEGDVAAEREGRVEETQPDDSTSAKAVDEEKREEAACRADMGLVSLNMSQSEDTNHLESTVDMESQPQNILEKKKEQPVKEKEHDLDALPEEPGEPAPIVETRTLRSGPKTCTATPRCQIPTDRLHPQQETQDEPRDEPQNSVEAQSEAAVKVDTSKVVARKETSPQALANEEAPAEAIANEQSVSEAVDSEQPLSETKAPEEAPYQAIASEVGLSAEGLVETKGLRSGAKRIAPLHKWPPRTSRSIKKKAEEETVETTAVKRGRELTGRKQISRTVKTSQVKGTSSAQKGIKDGPQVQLGTVDQAPIERAEVLLPTAVEEDEACMNEPVTDSETIVLTDTKAKDLETAEDIAAKDTQEEEPAPGQEEDTVDKAEGDVPAEAEDTVEETAPEESTSAEAADEEKKEEAAWTANVGLMSLNTTETEGTKNPERSVIMDKECQPEIIMEDKEVYPGNKEENEPAPSVETWALRSGTKALTTTPRCKSTTHRQNPQQETQDGPHDAMDAQSEVAVEVDLSIDLSVARNETSSEVLANEETPVEAIANKEEPSEAMATKDVELSAEGVVKTRVLRSVASRKSTGRKQVSRTVKTTQEERTYSAEEDTKDWPQLQSVTVDQAPIEGVEVPDVGLVPLNMSQSEDTKHSESSVDSKSQPQSILEKMEEQPVKEKEHEPNGLPEEPATSVETKALRSRLKNLTATPRHQRTTDRLDPQQETLDEPQDEPEDKPREEPHDAVEAQSEAAVEVGPSKAVAGKETSSEGLANQEAPAEAIVNENNISEAVDDDQPQSETKVPEEAPSGRKEVSTPEETSQEEAASSAKGDATEWPQALPLMYDPAKTGPDGKQTPAKYEAHPTDNIKQGETGHQAAIEGASLPRVAVLLVDFNKVQLVTESPQPEQEESPDKRHIQEEPSSPNETLAPDVETRLLRSGVEETEASAAKRRLSQQQNEECSTTEDTELEQQKVDHTEDQAQEADQAEGEAEETCESLHSKETQSSKQRTNIEDVEKSSEEEQVAEETNALELAKGAEESEPEALPASNQKYVDLQKPKDQQTEDSTEVENTKSCKEEVEDGLQEGLPSTKVLRSGRKSAPQNTDNRCTEYQEVPETSPPKRARKSASATNRGRAKQTCIEPHENNEDDSSTPKDTQTEEIKHENTQEVVPEGAPDVGNTEEQEAAAEAEEPHAQVELERIPEEVQPQEDISPFQEEPALHGDKDRGKHVEANRQRSQQQTGEECSTTEATNLEEEYQAQETTRGLDIKTLVTEGSAEQEPSADANMETEEADKAEDVFPENIQDEPSKEEKFLAQTRTYRSKHRTPRRSSRKKARVDYRDNDEKLDSANASAPEDIQERDKKTAPKPQVIEGEPSEGDVLNLILDEEEQSASDEEPVVIREKVLRGRSVPSLLITPHSKSSHRWSKGHSPEGSSGESTVQSPQSAHRRRLRKRHSVTPVRRAKRHRD